MSYPTKHGLAVHKGRWCKGKKSKRKPSRKGTVADRVVQKQKVDEYRKQLDKVKLGENELENVYTFCYLGAEIAGDGDNRITVKHRSDVAWGRFGDYRTTLTSTKLPVNLRVRLNSTLVVLTMAYGSSAWLFTKKMKQLVNGVNSKMLSLITKRTIHQEAKTPTFDIISHIQLRRWNYLGHILRLEEHRSLRKWLIELSPKERPFIEGTLFDDTNYKTIHEIIEAAKDRKNWRREGKEKWKGREKDD